MAIADWNSPANVQIFSPITSEFGIEPDSDLIEAESVGDLASALLQKGAFPEWDRVLKQAKLGVLRFVDTAGVLQPPSGSGWRSTIGPHDFFSIAFPTLESFEFPITLYLTTYYVEFNRPIFATRCPRAYLGKILLISDTS